MTKIKVFRFEVSNWSSRVFSDDKMDKHYRESQARIATEEYISDVMSEFLKDKEFVDMSVNHVDVKYHNNSRGNTIHLIYSIVYKDR